MEVPGLLKDLYQDDNHDHLYDSGSRTYKFGERTEILELDLRIQ